MLLLRLIPCCADVSSSSVSGDDEVDESKLTFLHGRLVVHVIAAEDLPDTDTAFFNIDGKDVTDPYVVGSLGPARLFKTKYIANELNPNWDERFDILLCHHASSLNIDVKDKEHVGDTFIASCKIREGRGKPAGRREKRNAW